MSRYVLVCMVFSIASDVLNIFFGCSRLWSIHNFNYYNSYIPPCLQQASSSTDLLKNTLYLMSQSSKQSRSMGYYQVEKIVGCRVVRGKKKYYWVKWKGWPSSSNTWQTQKNLETVKDLVQQFEKSKAIRTVKVQANNLIEEIETKPSIKPLSEPHRQEKRKRGRPKLAPELKKKKLIQKTKLVQGQKKMRRRAKGSLSYVSNRRKRMAFVRRTSEINSQQKTQLKVLRKTIVQRFQNKRRGLRGQQITDHLNSVSRKKSQQSENQSDSEHYSEDSKSEDHNIIEILKNQQNYPKVKVNFKDKQFYFTVPYKQKGKAKSLSLTTSQIIKINPFWLTKFYEGFFV